MNKRHAHHIEPIKKEIKTRRRWRHRRRHTTEKECQPIVLYWRQIWCRHITKPKHKITDMNEKRARERNAKQSAQRKENNKIEIELNKDLCVFCEIPVLRPRTHFRKCSSSVQQQQEHGIIAKLVLTPWDLSKKKKYFQIFWNEQHEAREKN